MNKSITTMSLCLSLLLLVGQISAMDMMDVGFFDDSYFSQNESVEIVKSNDKRFGSLAQIGCLLGAFYCAYTVNKITHSKPIKKATTESCVATEAKTKATCESPENIVRVGDKDVIIYDDGYIHLVQK